ncbi:uncharacterized protein LOC122664682 isoform X2 [Telopea speciosissima]|uniref:uncharacterized protein LOC122664682 isoform X2 n=1 Tax=Telopea speciosissima TaxID=54955 RepID=UPI001CC6DDAD|nr:uncharacterized protein LOC122664682 isoform X2 [Telopea speciosissima]
MDRLTLASSYFNGCFLPSVSFSSRGRSCLFFSFSRRPSSLVFASKDEPQLNHWDQMELKFGRMIGEDPKLTLAKIIGRKSNPDVSFLDIEKSFRTKKGKLSDDDDFDEIPFDGITGEGQSSSSLNNLNLVRPVPKKGIKFEAQDKPTVSEIRKPSQSVGKVVNVTKSSVPNVILRKPTNFQEDDIEVGKSSSRLKIKPNLLLKMRKEQPMENFTDITLLKKPEPMRIATDTITDQNTASSGDSVDSGSGEAQECSLESSGELETISKAKVADELEEDTLNSGGNQPLEQSDLGSVGKEAAVPHSLNEISPEATLQGKPLMLNTSTRETSQPAKVETVRESAKVFNDAAEVEHFLASTSLGEREDTDWAKAEDMQKTGRREEVELISCSTRGFVASFGSLIGFLPYRNLGTKWKFLAFESWLRKNSLDPSVYKKKLGIIGNGEFRNKKYSLDENLNLEKGQKNEVLSPHMKFEDLIEIYDQEKLKYLSLFVGQRIKVSVVLADRKSRRLIFSGKPKEREELVEKKRSLMAQLNVGDVVKCCITKITYFGIFVEVDGVPALIHQSEVSWDATLDPSSFFKIGQIVEAKVHQLDFVLERITLSLKEITPDPLIEALESVVGDHNLLDGRFEATQPNVKWADVDSLIKELEQIESIESVSKGRFFLSPGLAPAFQVYMASMFEKQYKLLARSGNKVQEVIVQSSLDKEEMKAAILTCTNRVE